MFQTLTFWFQKVLTLTTTKVPILTINKIPIKINVKNNKLTIPKINNNLIMKIK